MLSKISRTISMAALITFLGVQAEEQSILNGAKVSDFDIDFSNSWNNLALIDGNFKSLYHTTGIDNTGNG